MFCCLAQVGQKKRQHMQQLEEFVTEMESRRPQLPKYSKDLLIHRTIEGHLAKQGKYSKVRQHLLAASFKGSCPSTVESAVDLIPWQATRVKDAADRMEVAEMESTLATFEAELSLKVRALPASSLAFEAGEGRVHNHGLQGGRGWGPATPVAALVLMEGGQLRSSDFSTARPLLCFPAGRPRTIGIAVFPAVRFGGPSCHGSRFDYLMDTVQSLRMT